MVSCPLCLSSNIKKITTLRKDDLVRLYSTIQVNISSLVSTDIDYQFCENCHLYFYNPMLTGDENFYNQLQHNDWYYSDDKEEFNFSKKFIAENAKVLEVGSGKGAFAKHLKTTNYTGLDFSTNAKKMAEINGIKIENEAIEKHAENNAEAYDVVCSFQVLEHVSNPKAFIEAKLKALKKGGTLIVALPAEDSFLKYTVNSMLNMPPHHVTRWSDRTLKFIAEHYQLECLEIYHEKMQPVHIGWYFSTLIRNAISKPAFIDLSVGGKFLLKVTGLLSRILARANNKYMLPDGHTVIAVYKK